MSRLQSPAIFAHFVGMSDPRRPNARRHELLDLIVIALCAAICGSESWADVERFGREKEAWFRRFLRLEHGIPSHDTFGRVFARLDTGEFLGCLQNWVASLQHSMAGQHVALDGKTLRRSFDTAEGLPALHLVSAWASGLRLSLGHVAVDDKSNEIPAAVQLLNLLELQGAVVTLDAMHCQKETAATIRRRGADYLLSVKGNPPQLHAAVQQAFAAQGDRDFEQTRRHVTLDRKRRERREYYCLETPAEIRAQWPQAKSIVMVYRQREVQGKASDETAYFVSSLPPRVKTLARYIRAHWSIENSLHWVLDVTFSEDASRIRQGNAPEIAAVFRRLALSILQQDTTLKENIRGKRVRAGWNNDTLERILCGKKVAAVALLEPALLVPGQHPLRAGRLAVVGAHLISRGRHRVFVAPRAGGVVLPAFGGPGRLGPDQRHFRPQQLAAEVVVQRLLQFHARRRPSVLGLCRARRRASDYNAAHEVLAAGHVPG